jgi:hypothetical protein
MQVKKAALPETQRGDWYTIRGSNPGHPDQNAVKARKQPLKIPISFNIHVRSFCNPIT